MKSRGFKLFLASLEGFNYFFGLNRDFFVSLKKDLKTLREDNESLKKENAELKEKMNKLIAETNHAIEEIYDGMQDLAKEFKIQISYSKTPTLQGFEEVNLDGRK